MWPVRLNIIIKSTKIPDIVHKRGDASQEIIYYIRRRVRRNAHGTRTDLPHPPPSAPPPPPPISPTPPPCVRVRNRLAGYPFRLCCARASRNPLRVVSHKNRHWYPLPEHRPNRPIAVLRARLPVRK